MPKVLFLFLFFLLAPFPFLVHSTPVFADSQKKFITIVNPVRGRDFWDQNFDVLETPKKQYELISKDGLSVTWLVRYDALTNPQVTKFLKSMDNSQEIGLFLEVTPTFAKDAGVNYNQSPNWHFARSVLLTGYRVEDRKRLIDQIMKKYKEIFGAYPKSVGAWWIDAYSLNYLYQNYGVEANLDVADQYSTDQYQVWGQYFSTPFYPSTTNALIPASSADRKIGAVTIQWATRDPYNGYGNSVYDSTFSVQANDYTLHNLGIDYFQKLLNIYSQITVGLENDFAWSKFGPEYTNQLALLSKEQADGHLAIVTMSQFAQDYKSLYPGISPPALVAADDPLGGGGKVIWYQNSRYRVGWFYKLGIGSVIRDLRTYDEGSKEACLDVPCDSLNMAAGALNALDDATFGDHWIIDEGKITKLNTTFVNGNLRITYLNQAGDLRTINFLPNDIDVNGRTQAISFAIMDAKKASLAQSQNKVGGSDNLQPDFNRDRDQVLGSLLKFLPLVILFFLLPGWVISRDFVLAVPVGLAVFTLTAYILGFLKLDYLIWGLPAGSILLIFKTGLPKIGRLRFTKQNLSLFLVLILGSSSWLLTQVKNGLFFGYGLGYWGPNGHDGIWHLSLIKELQRNFPPQNPVFAGEALKNYHYLFDLLIATSGKLFEINTQDLLFRLFPLALSVFAGIALLKVIRKICFQFGDYGEKITYKASFLGLFFLYFGGSFGWIVTLLQKKVLAGETLFWAQQSISTLLNPPFAISIVLLLAGLWFFFNFSEDGNKKAILPLAIVWGTLVGFKSYAGVLVLVALSLLATERAVAKREFKLFIPLLLCAAISALVFLPSDLGSGGLFVYSPFWLIYSMVDFQDRLGWERLSLALHSASLYKEFVGLSIGTAIFIFGNLGLRALAFFGPKLLVRQRILLYISVLGFLLPMLFIQKGTNWNIIQFFYYTVFSFNIFAALFLAILWQKIGHWFLPFLLVVAVFTLPTTLGDLNDYLPTRPPAKLSQEEFEALQFLKNQPQGTVLTLSWDPKLATSFAEPVPLFAYTSTAYVSAFSNHQTFLEDTVNLDILGVDYKGRMNLLDDFLKMPEKRKEILNRNNISYVYVIKASGFQEDEGKMGVKKIFENHEVKIFKVI